MSDEKKRPRRVPRAVKRDEDAGYPTLRDFDTGRRDFLKQLGAGAVSAGVVAGAGVALWPGGAAAEGEHPAPLPHESMPVPGGMPAPSYEHVSIPASGTASAYLMHGSYLTYTLSFITYDYALAAFYRGDEASALKVASGILRSRSCEDVQGEALVELQEALREALMKYYESTGVGASHIESLSVVVNYCDDAGLVDGDMPAPDYP